AGCRSAWRRDRRGRRGRSGRRRGACSGAQPSPDRASPEFLDENDADLVVGELARVADEEVGRDPALRLLELALTPLDLPHDGAVAEVPVGRGAKHAHPDAAEVQSMAGAKQDRAALLEAA